VELDLQPQAAPPGGGANAGRDAADADLQLPPAVSFTLADGHAEVTQLADASWMLYGQSVDFRWQGGAAPTYEAPLESVLIRMTTSTPEIEPAPAESPFVDLAGPAPIHRAAWSLPAATIDVSHPTEASGAGGLAVQSGPGLSITWRGLR